MAGLELILAGVGPGDEVLVSILTFSASVNLIVYLGGRPTFIDSERTSWNMDLGIFSFNGNKIITTSGGGMLVSADKALIDPARKLSTQARDPAPHYQHSEIGYNYRLSNLLAAVGRGQLRVLEDRVRRKREIFKFYADTIGDLPGISLMPEAPWGRATHWLTVITVDPAQFGATREDIRVALEAENIESRPLWKPMHLQPVFQGYEAVGGGVAEALFRAGLCLPSGTAMSVADLARVVGIVRSVAR
jgi:pyridoxal phosphate-dependent aminotransferase EpsN